MNTKYLSVKHLESSALLPEKLAVGRAYFIDDEQVIIIDHGQGPVIYGGKPGPQGQIGEPIPQLQDQIDKLSAAELLTQANIWDFTKRSDKHFENVEASITDLDARMEDYVDTIREKHNSDILELEDSVQKLSTKHDTELTALEESTQEKITEALTTHAQDLQHYEHLLDEKDSRLQSQIDSHTSAITSLITLIQDKLTQYDSDLAILTKAISNLYPAPYADPINTDPLDGETLTTDAGSWTIEQTYLDDGTIKLELTAQKLLIDTLNVGDKVEYDGASWTVADYSTDSDGMVTITLKN